MTAEAEAPEGFEFAEAIAAIRTAPCSWEFQPMIDKLSDEDLVYILSTYDEWRGAGPLLQGTSLGSF